MVPGQWGSGRATLGKKGEAVWSQLELDVDQRLWSARAQGSHIPGQ